MISTNVSVSHTESSQLLTERLNFVSPLLYKLAISVVVKLLFHIAISSIIPFIPYPSACHLPKNNPSVTAVEAAVVPSLVTSTLSI